MQQENSVPSETHENDVRLGVLEAIAGKRLMVASYNGARLRLAPHALFLRHGELFVSALNSEKKRRSDEAPRLGHFKLGGIRAVEVLPESFDALADFEAKAEREGDELVLAIA